MNQWERTVQRIPMGLKEPGLARIIPSPVPSASSKDDPGWETIMEQVRERRLDKEEAEAEYAKEVAMNKQTILDKPEVGPVPVENGAHPEVSTQDNPWISIIGSYKDDPGWDAVMAHIHEQRRLDRENFDEVEQGCDYAEGADAMSKQAIKEDPKETMPSSANRLPPMDVAQGFGEPIKDHPLAKVFGVFKDNPMLDIMIENMHEYRRKVDEEEAARQDSNAE